MQESSRKVTVFVKSVKNVTSEKAVSQKFVVETRSPYSYTVEFPAYEEKTLTGVEFAFPEDQKKIVTLVQEIAPNHGFEVEVVDVTKENVLRREVQMHTKHITTFPIVITDDGRRIEGNITKQQVEALLTNEHKYL